MTDQSMTRANFAGFAIRLLLAAAVTVSASCGDLATAGKSPVYLIIESLAGATTPLLSDVLFAIATATVPDDVRNDVGIASISAALKNTVSPTAATSVNRITLTRYRVTFKRADGRNTPGVDVPYGFDGAITQTISTPGSADVSFDLVRRQNKEEPPLRNLRQNGALGGGGLVLISAIAEVTFYGHDQAGNEVSATGSIDVQFGDFR